MRFIPSLVSVLLISSVVALATVVAPPPAGADWPAFGRGVVTAPQGQQRPQLTTDGADGAIVVWQDLRASRNSVFAQHLRASGDLDPAWPADGRSLLRDPAALAASPEGQAPPLVVSDGTGGAIVAWSDGRSLATERDVFAQHVSSNGTVDNAWPANGTPLCVIQGIQDVQGVVSDGAGGAIVVWTDRRAALNASAVFAQHVLASGLVDPRWPVNGTALSGTPQPQVFPAVLADGAGGVIVAWGDLRGTSADIFAQHVLNSGVLDPAWPTTGRVVCGAAGDQERPTIASDGAQGAIVAWSDARLFATSHIFAQHVLGSGDVDPAWPLDGRAISAAGFFESRPLAVSDGAGGAIVNWQALDAHLNMYAQHVLAGGAVDPAWPAGGKALSAFDRQQTHAAIAPDGAGGAVVAWGDSSDIVAQHVLASGRLDPSYPAVGRPLCYLPSPQAGPEIVATSGGGAIAVWTDGRSGTDADVFALQVLAAGTVDVPSASIVHGIALERPSPNPARAALTLHFSTTRETDVRLSIFDVTGRRVRELEHGTLFAGAHSIVWDLHNDAGETVPGGIYFARLEAEGRAVTRAIARLD